MDSKGIQSLQMIDIRFDQNDFGRKTIFIIENAKCCFAFTQDRRIIKINCSFKTLESELSKDCFLRINDHTIINTKFYVDKQGKKEIIMKDGSIHKVSRQRWNDFK